MTYKSEDFSCSLNVLYGGLGISKLQFLIKKHTFFSAVNFFQFMVIKTWTWIWIRNTGRKEVAIPINTTYLLLQAIVPTSHQVFIMDLSQFPKAFLIRICLHFMKAKYLCNEPTNGDFFILINQPPDRRSKIDVTILQLSLGQNIPDFAWLLQSHS